MKIRDHVLTLTLVGLLGAFALAFVVWWGTASMGKDVDRLSDLSEKTGKASEEYLTAQKFLEKGQDAVTGMDLLAHESSGLFRFFEDMLIKVQKDLDELKSMRELPKELQAKLQNTFTQFRQQSQKVGAAIEKIKETKDPSGLDLNAYEDSAAAFVDAMEELDRGLGNLVLKHKENLRKEKQRVANGRKRTYIYMWGAFILYLVVLGFFAWRIHRILLTPITRMAFAADEAIAHGRSFTEDSFTKTPWAKPQGGRKKTAPKEIEVLSRRLWQLVNGLEETVEARTQELRAKHLALQERTESLEEEIKTRKELELELLHGQKMQAVGQLAAGIAHEIRTPIQYVGDHLLFIEEAVGALLTPDALEKDGREEKFLQENLPEAVEFATKGIERITEIVASMKRFSFKEQHHLKQPADLNQAVLDTVAISANEWKDSAALDTELDPDLPEVECLLGEINQVLLNLIVNATHAIRGFKNNGELGKITVRTTAVDDDQILIEVEDDGGGIPSEVRSKVFEPFFTTKEVGVGSGQGLAISHSVIVEKHKGELLFDTEMGRGTIFKIRLPVKTRDEK